MSLYEENIVQPENSDTTTGTSHAVTLGAGTTAGNTLIIITYCKSAFSGTPSGFALDAGGGALAVGYYRKSEVAAAETSWTFTTAGSATVCWYVVELSNIDPIEPLDVTASGSNAALANGGTLSTGTTAQNAGLSVISFAAWGGSNVSAATTSWAGETNSYGEVADVNSSDTGLAVARKFQDGTTGTFSSTATLTSTASLNANARVVAYRAADAPLAAPLATFYGFEWGTHAGMGNSSVSNPQQGALGAQGTFGTTYLVQGSSARNSNYGFRLAPSAATVYLLMGQGALGTSAGSAAFGMDVRVVSGSGTPIVASFQNTGVNLYLLYDVTNTKFGLRWGTGGTPSWQSGTTALNTWVWVDVRLRINSATYHADWTLETGTSTYTAQTSPADLTGQTAQTMNNTNPLILSDNTSQTITADYDNIVISRYYAAYPLSSHTVKLLTVDTSGTPTVSGTTTNFNVFTANGTLAAWNATNARNAVDEVPPTISASSDGVVQVTAAASDYMEFPMANPALASDEVVGAARWVGAMWGGTGTGTGTLGIKVSDGTTETVIDAGSSAYDADSLTTASATYPLWRQGLITPPSGGWTLTKANSLVSRIGYSSDATPDMGTSAFYIEAAIKKLLPVRVHTIEEGVMTADLYVNPYNSAAVSYVITNNDPTRTATFNYSISGTPQTPVTVAPGTGPTTLQLNADAFGDISETTLTA